jgi:two-component system nitrogen regulation sensor histidine kinase NtrY
LFLPNLRLEKLKRRREKRAALFIFILLIVSILVHALFVQKTESRKLVDSLTYLSVIYFYILIGALLVVLVARNLIKAYIERKTGQLGAHLKWKIVVSLVTFSIIPSLVFFVGATSLIRSGFEQYFGERVAGALEDSEAIVGTHYDRINRDMDLMATQVARLLNEESRKKNSRSSRDFFKALPLARLEIYQGKNKKPEVFNHFEKIPPTPPDLLERAFKGESFRTTTRDQEGDLIQRLQPFSTAKGINVLVLSQRVPMALFTRMQELKSALVVYQETRTIKNSLKTQYSIVLLVLFVLVLFVVTWFGIYITREITDPVLELLQATNAFRSGQWDFRIKNTGQVTLSRGMSADLEILKSAFNLMAEEVGTRGKKLEQVVHDLEGRERYLETLVSSIRRGVVVTNSEGRIQRINREALQLVLPDETHITPESCRDKLCTDLFKVNPKERLEDFLRAIKIKRGEHLDQVFEVPRDTTRDLPPLSLRASGVLLLDNEQKDLGILIILEDISESTRMERLAAWQGVARRVAHEIKNPLTPIQISADRIARKISHYPEDNPDLPLFKECLAQIQKQVRVIRNLVKEFSQFAKVPEPRFQKVQLTPLFEGFLKDYRFTHPDVNFSLESQTNDTLKGDPELLRILFVNIVDNALHSFQNKKNLNPTFAGALDIKITHGSKDDRFEVLFQDNGPGIEPELKNKIFDPYISSKSSGMGLGLAIVHRIAEEHSGSVNCEDAPIGARFTFDFPRWIEKSVEKSI